MASERGRRAPAWSRLEVLDLINLWGEESVLTQLRASKRNRDIYEKISQGMIERSHNRDTEQCRIKIKELRQAYQRTREANSRSGSSPKTCRYYDELHLILGRDTTSMPPRNIDTSEESKINDDDSVDEEELEDEENGVPESGVSTVQDKDQFANSEQHAPPQDSISDRDAGEGTSGDSSALGQSTPADHLNQIRKRKRKSRDDMFSELMRAYAAADTELRAWRLSLSEKLKFDMEDRRAARDQDWETQQEMLRIMQDQSDTLRRLVQLQEEQRLDRLPLETQQTALQVVVTSPAPPLIKEEEG